MRTLPEMLEHEIANEKKSAVQSAGERTNRGNRKQTGRDFGLGRREMRARKEQVAELTGVYEDAGLSGKDAKDAAEKTVSEAEERARAECAADTRRLDWLEKLPFADVGRLPNGWEICINNVRHWDMQPTLREAIDAVMAAGNE